MKTLILNAAKLISALGIITGLVWGVFKFYNGLQDGQEEILQQVEYLQVDQVFISEGVEDLTQRVIKNTDTLDKIFDHQAMQDEALSDMESAARFYIHNQKTFTEEAMEEAVEYILKKKQLESDSLYRYRISESEIIFEPQ